MFLVMLVWSNKDRGMFFIFEIMQYYSSLLEFRVNFSEKGVDRECGIDQD